MLTGTEVSTEQLVQLRARSRSLKIPDHLGTSRTGNLRSAIPGRGMDYEESRKYTVGDDSRMIDWRVTARTGTAHTKVFREDRQRMVYLIVDMSASMKFATRTAFKSVVAAEAASLIAWSALDQGNLVSITAISDTRIHKSRAASVPRSLTRQLAGLSNLSQLDGSGGDYDGLDDALSFIVRRIRFGDLVVVISDFWKLTEDTQKLFEYLCAKRTLNLVWVTDQFEREALPSGYYRITDGSNYSAIRLTSKRRRTNLQNALDERNDRVRLLVNQLSIPLIELNPGDDVSKVLNAAFHSRARSKVKNSRT